MAEPDGARRALPGCSQVLALADLYSARLQAAGYWTFVAGLSAVSLSAMFASQAGVRWSLVLWVISLAVFGVNLGRILAHLIQPFPTAWFLTAGELSVIIGATNGCHCGN